MFLTRRRSKPGIFAAMLVLWTSSLVAQQYSFRHYGAADGLENLVILSLAQDGAGFIWAGSEGGLYRYDGSRFRLMGAAEGLPCSAEVHALHVAADGALWANTCSQILRFDGQRFAAIPGLSGMLAGIRRMANDERGHVWVAARSGLYDVAPGGDFAARPVRFGQQMEGSAPGETALGGIAIRSSEIWFGCGRRLCLQDRGKLSQFGPADGLPDEAWDSIGFTPDGSVWVRSARSLYRKPPGSSRLQAENPGIGSSMFWGALNVGSDGNLMVPSDKGLAFLRQGNWSLIDQTRGLRTAITTDVLQDREGSIWIALAGGGLARWLGYGEWEGWTKAQGLPSDLIWSIRRDRKGALWVGTGLGLARMPPPGQSTPGIRTWNSKDGLGGDNVRWIGETSDAAIWAVTKPGRLSRIDPRSGNIRTFGRAEGLTCETSFRGFIDPLDRLWLATTCGVFRNDRPLSSPQFHYIGQPAELKRGAYDISQDKQGSIWVTSPQGLWRLSRDQWRHYRKADGLLSDDPYVIAIAPDGALWLRHRYDATTERVVFQGDRIVSATPVLHSDATRVEVTALHGFDLSGRFWRGGANGVSVLAGGFWRKMTMEDGLIWNDTDGEAFWPDADGSVWIGTSGGLAHYTPPATGWPQPPSADPILTRLDLDQKSRLVRAAFSSLSYKNEQLLHFAYRLDEDQWIPTNDRAVSFAGLGPGRHRVEVRSQVRNGAPSATQAVAEFELQPRWWETWAFRLLALLLAAAAVWGLVLWRNRLLLTQNRQLEEAVRLRTLELESERLNVLEEKKRADAASEAKGRFLATMSHEIRTPLNGIIASSRMLEGMLEGREGVSAEATELIELIRSSGDGLLRVVNDVLDFSKVEAGKLDLEVAPFHLPRALKECLGLFRSAAEAKGLRLAAELHADLPYWVAADGTRLRQVVMNLLSNALKFTSSGEVVLSARLQPHDQTSYSIAIEVRDTGMGMTPDQLGRLFESFHQADASISRRFGGTGLGLAISKRLVELMGGSITVHSQLNEGTLFRFTVLMGPAEAPAASPTPQLPALDSAQLSVLVAEDNKVNQKLLLMLLKKLGVHADLASDGKQALEAVEHKPYDLVLMDVEMPELDGLGATREIRSRLPAHRQPAIFGLTAHVTPEYHQLCLDAGMDGHLTKPIEPNKLRELLAGLPARSHSPSSLPSSLNSLACGVEDADSPAQSIPQTQALTLPVEVSAQ
jgi:signal transduction histidine kinase/CheY-like chemotaxis protein/streptogramin lyase